jgi:hypothetical protein
MVEIDGTSGNGNHSCKIDFLSVPVFSGFFALKTGFNRTRPVRFEPVFGPVRLIFHKINVIRFGWFF